MNEWYDDSLLSIEDWRRCDMIWYLQNYVSIQICPEGKMTNFDKNLEILLKRTQNYLATFENEWVAKVLE